ncbi:hypothetical protein V8C44DRAFT_329041 [Trichoderma aethiopicum]
MTSVRGRGLRRTRLSWPSLPLLLLFPFALCLFSTVGQPICSIPSTMASDVRGADGGRSCRGFAPPEPDSRPYHGRMTTEKKGREGVQWIEPSPVLSRDEST